MKLDSINVRLHPVDDDHSEIVVEAPWGFALEEDGGPTDRELLVAYLWTAGVLGRLAVVALPHVYRESRDHKCWFGSHSGCDLYGNETMLDPGISLGDPPSLCIDVPTARAEHWLKLIAGWLKAITSVQVPALTPKLRAVRGVQR